MCYLTFSDRCLRPSSRSDASIMPRLGKQLDLGQLGLQLAEAKKREKFLRDEARRLQKKPGHTLQRLNHFQAVAAVIFCRAQGNERTVMTCMIAALKNEPTAVVNDIVQKAKQEYATWSDDERAVFAADDGPGSSCRSTRTANRLLREHGLVHWVETRNLAEGIAPITSVVSKQPIFNKAPRQSACQMKYKSKKQWLRRWRLRWNISLGKIVGREQEPADVLHRKVRGPKKGSTFGFHFSSNSEHICVPTVPKTGTTMWS